MENDEKYLNSTHYCDFNDPELQKLAGRFKGKAKNENEFVKVIFEYVRDEFPFGVDLVKVKASETAKKGYGSCWSKSLLLIALLRYHQIPARLIRYPMKRDFQLFVGLFYIFMNNPFYHCAVEVFIENRWIKIDPTIDARLYNALYKPLNVKWDIQWDGKNDCVNCPDKMLGGPELFDNIDGIINANVGNLITPVFLPFYYIVNALAWKKIKRRLMVS